MIVLNADIGGTKTILQLNKIYLTDNAPRIYTLAEERYVSDKYDNFAILAKDFIAGSNVENHPSAACIAVAGPVEGNEFAQRSNLTNLTWCLDSDELSRILKINNFRIINDFEAIAYGVGYLDESSLTPIQTGILSNNNTRLVIGAGTGLGVCLMVWNGQRYKVIPTEGGHTGFAPANPEQDLLLQELRKKFEHVSIERIVSGPGLEFIYRFLCKQEGINDELLDSEQDIPAEITKQAQTYPNSHAAHALTIFVQCYGSYIGDAALGCLPSGGVFIAGGIAPKILWRLCQPDFLKSIRTKGRMTRLIDKLPISIVTNPKVGLIGAAIVASTISR